MNKKIERIITIGLAVGLVAYFCYQVAYGAKEICPGLMDGSKCIIMDITLYQYRLYDGKNAGLIAFYHVDDDCDSTIPAHTDIPMDTTHFSI
ncbi:MAG TPA: hypothetical protein VEL11_04220 [Candidatus Bathyarchaeia archaeon]|nr:hypothetical protein [Candidatus Bathyarchaeia archaeon]